jgi:DNA-binding SARP family transcriptional activator
MRENDRQLRDICRDGLHHGMTQRLDLEILGRFRLLDGQGREVRITSRKARALLARMAVSPGARFERDQLAAMLWEDAAPELARSSLRQALAALRRALPESLRDSVVSDASQIAIDADRVRCDAARLRALAARIDVEALSELTELYTGDLLEGFDAQSSAFDEWLAQERRTLRQEVLLALDRLARLCAETSDHEGEIAAWRRLVTIEPANERAHRALIAAYSRQGDHTAAVRQYRVCRDALRRELDVAPDPATDALYRETLRRRRAASASGDRVDDDEQVPTLTSIATEPGAAGESSVAHMTMREAVAVAVVIEGLEEMLEHADPEDATGLVAALEQHAAAVVRDHGGRTDRLSGDRLLAVFGMETTRGNEAEHAARAALALRSGIAALVDGATVHAAIDAGQLLAGHADRLFPLAGPPVARAFALARASTGEDVLVSDAVERALVGRCELALAPWEPVDGTPGVPRVWRVSDRAFADRPMRPQPFAGRRAEVSSCFTMLERVADSGRGRVIIIRGEAGIGKSRLIGVLRDTVLPRNWSVHAVQALDVGQRDLERPIAAMTAILLDLARQADAPARLAAVESAIGRGDLTRDDRPFAVELLAAPLPEPQLDAVRGLDVETRRHGRARVLNRLLRQACSHGPCLLVVEDVHWASAEDASRLADIAAALASLPAVLLMSTRPEDDPCTSTWRARARGCPITTVDLAPLSDDEARELALNFSGLTAEVVEHCLAQAAGHPLFLDQLLRTAAAGEQSLPGSVRALALAKADRLPGAAQRALHGAAVLGPEFGLDVLRELLDEAALDVAPLEAAGLLYETEPGSFAFTHALFRDAVHESMLKRTRSELHRRAAEIHATRDLTLRAWHLEQARDPRAAEASLAAARAEQGHERPERALELAQQAWRLAREPGLLAESAMTAGDLMVQVGRTHDAIGAYREAIDLASDRAVAARSWIGLASALRILDRYDEALAALDEAEPCLGDSPDPAMLARIWSLRGNLRFPRGEIEACLDAHERALENARLAGTPAEVARAYGGLGDAWYQRGHMQTAQDHFARCIEHCIEHSLTGLRLSFQPMRGITRAFCGRLAAGLEDCREAADAARQVGDLRAELLAHDGAAAIHLYMAKYPECLASSERVINIASDLGARRFAIEASGLKGLALFALGQCDAGRALLEYAVSDACQEARNYCAPWMVGALARVSGSAARRELLARGESLLGPDSISHNHLEFYREAIDVAIEEAWWSDVRRYADALEAYTRSQPLPWTALIIDRARALADRADAPSSRATRARLERVHDTIVSMQFLSLQRAVAAALAGGAARS